MPIIIKTDPISLGPFYRLPSQDNKLIRFWKFSDQSFHGYDAQDNDVVFTAAEAPSKVVLAEDIHDWPHLALTDPALPYTYDLLYDCKRPSELLKYIMAYPDNKANVLDTLRIDSAFYGTIPAEKDSPFAEMLDLI
jgi:hypothetical protein